MRLHHRRHTAQAAAGRNHRCHHFSFFYRRRSVAVGPGIFFWFPRTAGAAGNPVKTVIEGVLQADLPWGLVLTGAALAGTSELLGIPSLPFAVGIYLPCRP